MKKEAAKKQEIQIMDCGARELHTIEFIAGLDCQLAKGEQYLEPRLRSIPDLWRQYRIAMKAIEKVLDGIYRSIPLKTLKHMRNLCAYGEVIIKPKGPVNVHDVQIVPTPELKLLINTAIENECAVCVKDQREQKGCKLRKAMMLIAPPLEVNRDYCNYRDVAAENELGKYI